MLDLGFIEDVEKILRMCPSGRQTALFSATMPPPIARLAERLHVRPGDDQDHAEAAHRRRDRAGLRRGRAADKTERLIEVLQGRGARAGDHLLPDQDRHRPARPRSCATRGLRVEGAARRHEPGPARRRDDRVQGRGTCRCWSPPTSPPAGSTSSTSPTSSTTTCRTTPRSTSTGSAAPAASAGPAARSPSSPPSSATRSSGSSARRRPRSASGSRPRSGSSTPRARGAATTTPSGRREAPQGDARRRARTPEPDGTDHVKLFVNRGSAAASTRRTCAGR